MPPPPAEEEVVIGTGLLAAATRAVRCPVDGGKADGGLVLDGKVAVVAAVMVVGDVERGASGLVEMDGRKRRRRSWMPKWRTILAVVETVGTRSSKLGAALLPLRVAPMAFSNSRSRGLKTILT
jgi:hypothetical protein